MPDFRNYQITPLGNAQATVPRFRIEARIHHSQTGAQLADYTGQQGFVFPDDLNAAYLTAADKREFVELIAGWVLERRRQRGG